MEINQGNWNTFIKKTLALFNLNVHLQGIVGSDPVNLAGHASVDIREATGTGDSPGHGSDDGASRDQWATRVSHAGSLSGLGEGADLARNDHSRVGRVTSLAVSVGDHLGVQEHQVGGSSSGVL